jgi:hypothetical protein
MLMVKERKSAVGGIHRALWWVRVPGQCPEAAAAVCPGIPPTAADSSGGVLTLASFVDGASFLASISARAAESSSGFFLGLPDRIHQPSRACGDVTAREIRAALPRSLAHLR